jgi:hypothetical protein
MSLAVTMTMATWPKSSIRRKPSASTPPRATDGGSYGISGCRFAGSSTRAPEVI